MILKFKTMCVCPATETESEYRQEQWHYIDGITEATTYYDAEIRAVCVRITDAHQDGFSVIALHDEAYLLNDAGKTIEKVRC